MPSFLDIRSFGAAPWYLLVDDRYLMFEGGKQIRRALGFGPNVTPKMAGGLLAPPAQPGEFAYGWFDVLVEPEEAVVIVDSWVDSYPVGVERELDEIIARMTDILAEMDDDGYRKAMRGWVQISSTELLVQRLKKPTFAGLG